MKTIIIHNLKIFSLFFCLGTPFFSSAQICTGSLGDPLVNVTFGNGLLTGTALPAGVTSYNFVTSNCPIDGEYTIASGTTQCFSSTWHTLNEDHTPNDVNGDMMIVNASFAPSDFYIDTIKNLCANTTFEFSAWVINLLKKTACGGNGTIPNLVFNIETLDGIILNTYSTNNIFSTDVPVWRQFGFFFTTPINANSVVIRIRNNALGGCGNDLAIDDITFRPCGPIITSTIVNNNSTSINVCKNNIGNIILSATIGAGFTTPSLQWQQSKDMAVTWLDVNNGNYASYPFIHILPGTYMYRLLVANGSNINSKNCRVASNIDTIIIHDFPTVVATSNSPLCEKSTLQLTATDGAKIYNWVGPNFSSSLQNPNLIASPNTTGDYTVFVTDGAGCKNSASVKVIVSPAPKAVATADTTICNDTNIQLQSSGGSSYSWYPSIGLSNNQIANPVANPSVTTLYRLIVSNANNCSDTTFVKITVINKPTANAGADKVILLGSTAILDGTSNGSDYTIYWTPTDFLNNNQTLHPTSTAKNDIVYTLHVESKENCGIATDEVSVKVVNGLYVPTAFSPNNDGINETWQIKALAAYPNSTFSIYNRYGEKIFDGKNESIWDGTYKNKYVDAGSYIYVIDLKNNTPIVKGTVNVLR